MGSSTPPPSPALWSIRVSHLFGVQPQLLAFFNLMFFAFSGIYTTSYSYQQTPPTTAKITCPKSQVLSKKQWLGPGCWQANGRGFKGNQKDTNDLWRLRQTQAWPNGSDRFATTVTSTNEGAHRGKLTSKLG